MENNKQNLSIEEKEFYIELITNRFLSNPRMLLLFSNHSQKKYHKKVKKLVEYCFYLALRLNGVYVTGNKKTIVLFYKKKQFKQNGYDYLRYFKVLLNVKIKNIFKILKNEKTIKKNKLKVDDHLYIWFIAQEKNYKKLDGLIEINKMIFNYSKQKNLPILLETSNVNLLNLYKRAGFKVYNTLKIEQEIIYFLTDTLTFNKFNLQDNYILIEKEK